MEHEYIYNNQTYGISLEKGKDKVKAKIEDREYEVDVYSLAPGLISLQIDDRSILVHTAKDKNKRYVCIGGVTYELAEPTDDVEAGSGSGGGAGDGLISTPMPGKIVVVHVKEGDQVEKNQALLVVESMKMQNDILSDVNGVVKKVHFKAGDQAGFGDPLVEIEVDEDGQ